MLFSSVSFIFGFLPIVLILYYAIPKQYRNLMLLIASLFFYFWGEPLYSLLMLASILSGYIHGLIIEKYHGTKWAKVAIVSSLVTSLGALAVFKYCDFFISSFNSVFGLSVPLLRIALPLGISFYTFQILSYTIDVYRGDSPAQRSFVAFGAYISMFPQLVAGPIVRYSDIEKQLHGREYTMSGFALGVRRFIVGLSKKIIFANTLAELTAEVSAIENPDTLACWLLALGFALQIYFDFSGYSDMARGLGGMLGFEFPENFRYPYISASVSEFWRRWHMTLGTWFRDYVYFPLGGSRVKSKGRLAFNLAVVWALTGLWHGASWSFVIWGVYFGVFIIAEKLLLGKKIENITKWVRVPLTLLIVIIGFVIFNAPTLGDAGRQLAGMFAFGDTAASSAQSVFQLRNYGLMMLAATVFATPLPRLAAERVTKNGTIARVFDVLEFPVLLVLLAICTAYLIDGSFNPFLYFRF